MEENKRVMLIQIAIAGSVLLGCGLGIAFFVFQIRDAVSAIVGVRQEILTRNTQIQSLTTLRTENAIAAPLIDILKSRLPNKDALFAFSRYIERLGRERGISAGSSFGSETAISVSFTASFEGEMDKTIAFISDLERGNYLTQLSEISFENLSGRIVGAVFFKP